MERTADATVKTLECEKLKSTACAAALYAQTVCCCAQLHRAECMLLAAVASCCRDDAPGDCRPAWAAARS
eukprot:scaffold4371_cov125-Isochrysis_galbana.AAC.2